MLLAVVEAMTETILTFAIVFECMGCGILLYRALR
jgi:hypothetical protein